MELILIPLFGFFVFMIVTIVIAASRHKAIAEQQNRQRMHEQEAQQAQKAAPVRPAVQAKRPPMIKVPEPAKKNNLKTEAPDTLKVQTVQAKQKPILTFSGDEAVKGILYAEILGKPKALR